jgi:eukaryotic-like serine/threonine-protein kinase
MIAPVADDSGRPRVFQRRYQSRRVLGSGSMGEVHACFDRLTGAEIALKRLRRDGLRRDMREHASALAHEFRLLASMRHENIIGVRSFGVDEGDPFFTMDLRKEGESFVEAARARDEDERVELLLQCLRALAYLERRGVVHRDLKPNNVLVDAGRVCLLDFGLAALRDADSEEPTAGNLAYASPEVLRGAPCSVASDLYAVGVMAYEVFAGRHPHADDAATGLVRRVLTEEPDLDRIVASSRVKATIAALLSKSPAERPGSALAVAEMLAGGSHRIETEALRESFLSASTMVGRDPEIERLDRLVADCLANHGCALLIGGESGVGKSRVLDELRARALVGAVTVFEGGAVEQAASPYQVFQTVLLQLAVCVPPTPLEAAVLAHVVPRLSSVVDVPAAPLVSLDPSAVGDRLSAAMKSMLSRLDQPWVAVLEDLHWMTSEDLRLLRDLVGVSAGSAAVVGTYREDERPTLPEELGVNEVLRLSRLDGPHIEALAKTMLGHDDVAPELVDFLRTETQGNPFFMVEVLRVLAESAERLDSVDASRLPRELFPDGVRRVLERRFARLPHEARGLLDLAAVAGRALDLDLLRVLHDGPIDPWIDACMNALVIETFEGVHRFAHDRLRGHVLERIDAQERATLHGRVAAGIEGYLPSRRALLARRRPGASLRNGPEPHEGGGVRHAGRRACAVTRGLRSSDRLPRAFGRAGERAPGFECRDAGARQATARSGLHRARSTRRGSTNIEASVTLLGHAPPTSAGRQVARMLAESSTQVRRRIDRSPPKDPSQSPELLLEAARGYDRLAEAYFFAGDQGALVHASLKTLNLAEAVGRPTPELAMAYANITGAMGLVPWRRQAEHYAASCPSRRRRGRRRPGAHVGPLADEQLPAR